MRKAIPVREDRAVAEEKTAALTKKLKSMTPFQAANRYRLLCRKGKPQKALGVDMPKSHIPESRHHLRQEEKCFRIMFNGSGGRHEIVTSGTY